MIGGRRIFFRCWLPVLLVSWPVFVLGSPGPVTAQSPPTYEAMWVSSGPEVDGRLTEAVWSLVPWTRPFMDIRGEDWPAPTYDTRVKLLWDDDYLYVGAELMEPHVWGTLSNRDAIIYREDDFEVFLDPGGDGLDYFEIEVNALGTVLDLFLDRPYGRGGRAKIDWDSPGLLVEVEVNGTLNDPSDRDVGWVVEMAIPWQDLVPPTGYSAPPGGTPPRGVPPAPGEKWRMNFSRVDWPLEIVPNPQSGGMTYRKSAEPTGQRPHPEANWVWSPQGAINMHMPERWGTIRFQGPNARSKSVSGPTPGGER